MEGDKGIPPVKELLVISGKGGTGKTTLVASFSRLAERAVLADCDVDAPDLWILLEPREREKGAFYGGQKPRVDHELCNRCGQCTQYCRFDAIEDGEVDYIECEGCGLCELVCPEGAIRMQDHVSGYWFVSDTPFGPLIHARLNPGEENSGKLVAEVKRRAREVAEGGGYNLVIVDGPPGVGCPVISALSGVTLALVVSEPSISAIHDLQRALDLCETFGVRAAVAINRFDVSPRRTREIEALCDSRGVEVIGRIPFDRSVVEALNLRKTPLEYPSGIRSDIVKLWDAVKRAL